jgi:hypothetical protein
MEKVRNSNGQNEDNNKKVYQAPAIYTLRSFVKRTLGNKFNDTADLKNYYS